MKLKRLWAVVLAFILCFTAVGTVPYALAQSDVTINSCYFTDANGNVITTVPDGSVKAKINITAPEGEKLYLYLAAYNGGKLYDAEVSTPTVQSASAAWYDIPAVSCTKECEVKVFVWSADMLPYEKPSAPSDNSGPLLSFGFEHSAGYYRFMGDIDTDTRTVYVDLPVECLNMTSASAYLYSEDNLESLTPQIELADGWTASDTGAKDFTEPVEYTFTNGELKETYTVIANSSVLNRSSNFESVQYIDASFNNPATVYTNNLNRHHMPYSGHNGNGVWYQVGYREDATTQVVNEDETYGDFTLEEENSNKVWQINKTKPDTANDMYMYSTSADSKKAAKYRLSSDIYIKDVTTQAYITTADGNKLYFIKNSETAAYDLYAQKDSEKILLKKSALENEKWYNIAVSFENKYVDNALTQEVSVYIDGLIVGSFSKQPDTITTTKDNNFSLGIAKEATGIIRFDNWRTTFTDWDSSREDYPNVWVLGDSLASDYASSEVRQGIGTYLSEQVDMTRVNVKNIAISGSTTSDFIETDGQYYSKWTAALAEMKNGDVLLVELGYNDSNMTDYAANLKTISETTHGLGVEPVFVTTNVQLDYDDKTIINNKLNTSVAVMKEVCSQTGDVCLDMNTEMWNYFTNLGYDAATQYYQCTETYGYWLHFNKKGAQLGAKMIADLAKQSSAYVFRELLVGGYIGSVTEFNIGGYSADVLANALSVTLPGKIGGDMYDNSTTSLADMDFSYKSTGGVLSKVNDASYLYTGENGNTKTYTLKPDYYTELVNMDFDNVKYNKDGYILNYPASNDKGAAEGGYDAVWKLTDGNSTGGTGTVSIENGKLRMVKSVMGASLSEAINTAEYPADTDKIYVSFDMKVNEIIDQKHTSVPFMRVDIGENIPCLAFRRESADTPDKYVIDYYIHSDWWNGSTKISNSPELSVGEEYSFDIVYTRDDEKVVADVSIDGEKAFTLTRTLATYEQAALLPQFQIFGNASGAFDAEFDNVKVGYDADGIKEKQKVILVGDSICYSYPSNETDIQGWGKTLAEWIDSDYYEVVNTARPGQATGIYLNGYADVDTTDVKYYHKFDLAQTWTYIEDIIKEGDYVIIGLGWNDTGYYTEEVYKANLKKMIDSVKSYNATPVIVTTTILYNTTAGAIQNARQTFAGYAKSVAEAEGVVCLDLNTYAWNTLSNLADSEVQKWYRISANDGTHHTPYGSQKYAELICDLIEESELDLKNYITAEETPSDTDSNLVTFEDFDENCAIDVLNADSRLSASVGGGSVTVVKDPENTRGKVLKMTTIKGKNGDGISFKMPSTSGATKATAEFDLYIDEDSTTGVYDKYNYMFNFQIGNAFALPFGMNENNTSVTGASWAVRSDLSNSGTPKAVVFPNSSVTDESLENGFEKDTWYTCKVVYDFSDYTADIYVNDTLVYENCTHYIQKLNAATETTEADRTSIGGLVFSSLYQSVSTVYIDNVSLVYE